MQAFQHLLFSLVFALKQSSVNVTKSAKTADLVNLLKKYLMGNFIFCAVSLKERNARRSFLLGNIEDIICPQLLWTSIKK